MPQAYSPPLLCHRSSMLNEPGPLQAEEKSKRLRDGDMELKEIIWHKTNTGRGKKVQKMRRGKGYWCVHLSWHASILLNCNIWVRVCVCACAHFLRHFLQPLWKCSSSAHCRKTPPAVISGFSIYYAVRYYIKSCLFCVFFSSFLAYCRRASGSFPQWEDNPESSQGSSDPPHTHFQTCVLGWIVHRDLVLTAHPVLSLKMFLLSRVTTKSPSQVAVAWYNCTNTSTKDSPLVLPARQTDKRLMTVLASGSRERNWHVSGGE